MGFKLEEILTEQPVIPLDRCVTGKTAYPTKAAAQAAVVAVNRQMGAPMNAFRCLYCERYHLGHRRGVWKG